MKKRPANEDSDEFDADEPEEFEESGSDWDPEEEETSGSKKKKGRAPAKPTAKKTSNSKKKKIEKPPSDEEDEENEDEDEEGDGGEDDEEESDDETGLRKETDANGNNSSTTTPNIQVKAFTNGSFVVLKTDLQAGGTPHLWKIDGKALLQKYVPFEQDGKTLYRNTSTYSGWTPNSREQYTAAPIKYIQQGKKEIIIEFHRDQVKLDGDKDDGEKVEAQAAEDA